MTTPRRLGLMSVSALVALSTAISGGTPAASEPTPAPTVSRDSFVAAMQRDLGLTEVQVHTRLRQESTAMAIDGPARAAAGAAYGGSWFDPERGTLVVGLSTSDTSVRPDTADASSATGAPDTVSGLAGVPNVAGESAAATESLAAVESPAAGERPAADESKAAGAVNSSSAATTPNAEATPTAATASVAAAVRATGAEVVFVPRTLAELDALKAKLDVMKAPADVASWRVDPRTGSVVVSVRRGGDAAAFLAAARRLGPVTVEQVDALPQPFAAGTVGGDPYYINNSVRCSIGFSVHGGFVSAGHCGGVGASVAGWDRSWMGTFAGSSFPGNDYSFIRIGGGWWTVPVVLGWGTVPDRLVRGSAVAPVGSSICRSGSTTRWHCGTVLAMNETVNYQQGAVHQMTKTSVCAQPGDSGGSFITGEQAQGVTSGGWGNCSTGGQTWFQPVNEILGAYGLSLVVA